MKRWPLKLKVGVYCASLTVLALLASAAIILPVIYHRHVAELDRTLTEDQEEVFERLTLVLGPKFNGPRPITTRAIPARLQNRYLQIEGINGAELYRSAHNLRDADLRHLTPGHATINLFGKNCRIGTFERGPLTVHIGTRLGTIERMQQDLFAAFSFAIPVLALFVFLGGLLLARHALKPVSAMTAAAERISAQSPHERLPAPTANDEIARLTMVLNQSFDRLQRAYSSAARFSADASHQLKTPIAVLRAGLDELRVSSHLAAEDAEIVAVLLQQTRRLTTLVEDLLLLAQADAGRLRLDPAPLDLAPLLSMIADDIEALGAERGLTITCDAPAELYAQADARHIKIILQNLGENAVKYNVPNGRIVIHAHREGETVKVSVGNTGLTISPLERDRLFERFNRAGVGENIKGHGLGLNIARELARAHGGELSLVHSAEGWTEFLLTLPACDRAVAPPDGAPEPGSRPAVVR